MELLLPILFSLVLFIAAVFVIIPGLPVMFFLLLTASIFAFVDGFVHLSLGELAILTLIYIISFIVDLLSGVVGAKYGGASLRSLSFGFLGAALGMLVFPPLGAILGLFLGVLISEFFQKGNHRHAFRAASFGVLGFAVGVLVNIVIALAFLGAFIFLVFFFG